MEIVKLVIGIVKHKQRNQGFTLVELLIVLLIISIVTSVALLTISHNKDKQVELFVSEFKQIITLAEEQAMLQPVVLGLAFDENSYQFINYHPAEGDKKSFWSPEQGRLLNRYQIPRGIELTMGSAEDEGVEESAKKSIPQIVISTNGDLTPFTVYVGLKGKKPRFVIQGDTDGTVTSQRLS
jgi:general secretion pathway protein H